MILRKSQLLTLSLSSWALTLKVKLLFEVLLKGLLAVVVLAVLGRHLGRLRLGRPRRLVLSQRLRRGPPRHRGRWFRFLLEIHLWPSWEVGGHPAITLPLPIWPSSAFDWQWSTIGQLLFNYWSSIGNGQLLLLRSPDHFWPFCVQRLTFGWMQMLVNFHRWERPQRQPMHKSQLLQIFFSSNSPTESHYFSPGIWKCSEIKSSCHRRKLSMVDFDTLLKFSLGRILEERVVKNVHTSDCVWTLVGDITKSPTLGLNSFYIFVLSSLQRSAWEGVQQGQMGIK